MVPSTRPGTRPATEVRTTAARADTGDNFGDFQQARTKASDEGDGTDKHKDETEGAYQENKSYEEETAQIRWLLNKYGEGETRFQTLLRMMDIRMYPTKQDPNRKKHLTKGTKEKAETKQNSVLQAKTKEERVNPEPGA